MLTAFDWQILQIRVFNLENNSNLRFQGVDLSGGDVNSLHLCLLGLSAEFLWSICHNTPCAKRKLPTISLKMEGKEHLEPREGNELKST